MTAKGTPSAQDGFKSYCRAYDRNQRDLQERAMAKKPDDVVTVPNGPGISMAREHAETHGLAYVAEPARDGLETLPCPHCGQAPTVHECDWSEPATWSVLCGCTGCMHETAEQAIAAWNTRAPAPPTEAQIARAAAAICCRHGCRVKHGLEGEYAVCQAHTFVEDACAALTAAQGEKEGG